MSKTEKLQEYFEFTQSDLQENRSGQISENQKEILKKRQSRYSNRMLIAVIVIAVIGMGALAISGIFSKAALASGNFSSILTGGAGVFITPVLLIGFLVYRNYKKSDTSLKTAEGTVNFVWVESRERNPSNTGPDYKTVRRLQMRVGGVSFYVNENLIDTINQDENCKFYYTGGGDIISAEFIGTKE